MQTCRLKRLPGVVPAGENVGQVKASSYQAQELQEQ